ncbi:CAF17-like 4Fe-4S cluster assembly/insertion protein YgfZ [Parerythrobacter jejuensis]|uniref:Folate-binding protein n=1 Tax=Parerythrobacter jejuensis TaxID=795812 RepID=A0A845ARN2_9SPHN|nr:folate-binding protein YgfZ [Parerythrobacter jejuensis]MXP31853.1 folate-binding protein [Parerythrobacter jejuensis]
MTAKRLSNRAVIRLSPLDGAEDIAEFLQGLVTNDVKGALPAYAALLSPQGKALFDFIVWADGDDLLIDCEADAADELTKRLSMYQLRRKIAIARDDQLGVFWQRDASGEHPTDPRLETLGARWVGPVSPDGDSADADWLAHRLSLGVPEGRAELGDILWLETNAVELNGVSFEKGCYVGQENTARMNWRQKVNRRLLVVPLDQADPKRTKVRHEDHGLAVIHQRVADIDPSSAPDWMRLEAS